VRHRRSNNTLVRIAALTASLVIGGALVGAVLGASLLALLGLVADGPGGFPDVWFAFEVAAVAGAIFGGVGLPLVSWTLLRHVPFYRIVLETGIGTALGASIGLLGFALNPLTAAGGAAAGFLLGAIQLRLRTPPGTISTTAVSDAPGDLMSR
jgi:hypothetical protein